MKSPLFAISLLEGGTVVYMQKNEWVKWVDNLQNARPFISEKSANRYIKRNLIPKAYFLTEIK